MDVELDSHADTGVFGEGALMVEDTGQRVTVEGYSRSLGLTKDIPVVTVAVAYDCPTTMATYILFFPQSLHLPQMDHHLLPPFQLRENGVTVNDIPIQHTPEAARTATTHSIVTEDPYLAIPLQLRGTFSAFPTRKPTWDEVLDFEEKDVFHVQMTAGTWDPKSISFADLESNLRDHLQRTHIDPRQLSTLQLRGQDSETSDTKGTQHKQRQHSLEGTSGDQADGTARTQGELEEKVPRPPKRPRLDEDEDGAKEMERPSSPVGVEEETMESLQQEFRHCGAIDVDRAAGLLLDHLDPEPAKGPDEDNSGLEAFARGLAAVNTIKKRKGFVSAERLAKNWGITLEVARNTIKATTQMAVRDFSSSAGGRRLKPHSYMLKYRRSMAKAYTDTMFAKTKSLRGNTCAQVYVDETHTIVAIPMKEKKDAHTTLPYYFHHYGVPSAMVPDNAKELTEGKFRKMCNRFQTPILPIEPYQSNQNIAEAGIRELKRNYTSLKARKGFPEQVWDDAVEWLCKVRSLTALNIPALEGQVPLTKHLGDTADISFIAEHGFYDWVWFIDSRPGRDTIGRRTLARYLGPDPNIGDAMCGRVLTEKGSRVITSSIIPLKPEEHHHEDVKRKKEEYNASLSEKLKMPVKKRIAADEDPMRNPEVDDWKWADTQEESKEVGDYEEYQHLDGTPHDGKEQFEERLEADELEAADLDMNKYIGAKVRIPDQGITFANGVVIGRARDETGELIGKANRNPLLDSSVYLVKTDDGAVERYTANVIAEHIYSQVDQQGFMTTILDSIVEHKTDETALTLEQAKELGTAQNPKQTTKGWKFLVNFRDGSSKWMKMKDLKDTNPIELAEYGQVNALLEEPSFRWWAPHMLRQRRRTLKAMKTRYHRTAQKFGIELPKTVKRALQIDVETGTTFWKDAINKEMKTVSVAFEIKDSKKPPPGYKFLRCHMVFDIKPGSLKRKARFVADGSRIDPEGTPTYASVVSRESVRIAFMIAALNDLDIWAADCEGAYLNAPCREKLYTILGPEFGEHEGKIAVIIRALYGSKSAAASWRSTISSVIEKELGFTMCRADNDVWMRRGKNRHGMDVYEYILVYSDDLLVIGKTPKEILEQIATHFKLKEGSMKRPDTYLGAQIGKCQLGIQESEADSPCMSAWYQSPDPYTKSAIENVERWLLAKEQQDSGLKLKTKASSAMPANYKPELDVTPELAPKYASWYMQQIGVLRWMVELGRWDIITEVSALASHMALPRAGHLAALLHLFSYIKQKNSVKSVYDPRPFQREADTVNPDWADHYPDARGDVVPPDAPEPLGNPVQTTCYVDSDHAGDCVTRRSRTGVLIYVQRSPILVHSKKQGSIEASSFGSELTAMKTATELVEGLRYKLRMMGIPLDGPTHVKADNMSVVHNCSRPESQLKKKSLSIAYHYVRERCAGKEPVIAVSYVKSEDNLADAMTKFQPAAVRDRLIGRILKVAKVIRICALQGLTFENACF